MTATLAGRQGQESLVTSYKVCVKGTWTHSYENFVHKPHRGQVLGLPREFLAADKVLHSKILFESPLDTAPAASQKIDHNP